MHYPKVTIITPSFNCAATIEACLRSVAEQSYTYKEHLIIDNASTDGTVEIVSAYASRHQHIRLISESDKGIYDAMNKGIDRCSGEWVYFLGSDDTFSDTSVLAWFFETSMAENDIMYGNVLWGNSGSVYDGEFSPVKLMEKNICHQAIFFRREVFERLGMYDLRYKSLADWVFNMIWFCRDDIRSIYRERVVAVYNPEGFSSRYQDNTFRENHLALIEQHFPEGFHLLFESRKVLAEREEQIRQLFASMSAQECRIGMLNRDVQELQKRIIRLDEAVTERDNAIVARDQHIRSMTNSRSWKMIKPLYNMSKSITKRATKVRELLKGHKVNREMTERE